MACRQEHIAYIDKLKAEGKALLGAAQLDNDDEMCGSAIFFNMSQAEMDEYLQAEPYIVNDVWDEIEVRECKIGPSFLKA